MVRRVEQRVDPVSGELFVRTVYNPPPAVASGTEGAGNEGEGDTEENEEEGEEDEEENEKKQNRDEFAEDLVRNSLVFCTTCTS